MIESMTEDRGQNAEAWHPRPHPFPFPHPHPRLNTRS